MGPLISRKGAWVEEGDVHLLPCLEAVHTVKLLGLCGQRPIYGCGRCSVDLLGGRCQHLDDPRHGILDLALNLPVGQPCQHGRHIGRAIQGQSPNAGGNSRIILESAGDDTYSGLPGLFHVDHVEHKVRRASLSISGRANEDVTLFEGLLQQRLGIAPGALVGDHRDILKTVLQQLANPPQGEIAAALVVPQEPDRLAVQGGWPGRHGERVDVPLAGSLRVQSLEFDHVIYLSADT